MNTVHRQQTTAPSLFLLIAFIILACILAMLVSSSQTASQTEPVVIEQHGIAPKVAPITTPAIVPPAKPQNTEMQYLRRPVQLEKYNPLKK